jgi:hypothetical protein
MHVELEGGGAVIDPDALLGRKGREAHEAAYEKLRRMI